MTESWEIVTSEVLFIKSIFSIIFFLSWYLQTSGFLIWGSWFFFVPPSKILVTEQGGNFPKLYKKCHLSQLFK